VIDDLGYPDAMEGYDRKILVILDDNDQYLSAGAMGVTGLLSNGDPYIAVDPWMSDGDLQITMGHEYFHTVQFGYDSDFAYTDQGINWAEATAVWIEDQQYDSNNDYVNYISEFFDYVDYSVFASVTPSGSLYEYGLNIWPIFLSEYYDTGVIKDIWEAYFDSSASYEDDRKLYDAVDSVVSDEDDRLDEVFRDFTLWNLDLSEYSEGSLYPQVFALSGETGSDYQQIEQDYAPALFGTNYIYFENNNSDTDFYFHVVKPEGVSFAVTLLPYDAGSVDLSEKVSLIVGENESMLEVMELSRLGNAEGVYAVISPLEADLSDTDHTDDFDQGYLYDFFADYGDSGEDHSSVIEETATGDSSTSTDQKEGESAGTTTPLSTTLNLSVVSYDSDSVSFSWNRLTDSDIDSYELRYGTESGDYSDEKSVDHAYVTSATVSGLEEGTSYYFEVQALDEDGDSIGSPSPELTVIPQAWLFTDVSYLDDHYTAIAALTEQGVFSGYSDGSFRPNDEINRAELLKILIEGQDLTPSASTYKNCFTDVTDAWYAKYVCYAKAQGWVQGYSDGRFLPGNAVNKVEALKILFETYEAGVSEGASGSALSYSDLDQNAWYASYVAKASELGILSESPSLPFNPSGSRTRGDMADELYRYLVVEELIKE